MKKVIIKKEEPDSRVERNAPAKGKGSSKKSTLDTEKGLKELNDLQALNTRAEEEFEKEYWTSGKRNARFYLGEHWDDKEKADFEAEGRIPYNIPKVEIQINSLLGEEMLNKFNWKITGRESSDEIGAELATHIYSYIEESSDFEYTESDIFIEGLCKKYGVAERISDYTENPDGDVLITDVPFEEFMWDTNCRKFDISKYASWAQRIKWITKNQLKQMYPEKEDKIDRLNENYIKTCGQIKDVTNWYRDDNGEEIVKIVEHHQRTYKPVYKAFMPREILLDGSPRYRVESFDSPAEADNYTEKWVKVTDPAGKVIMLFKEEEGFTLDAFKAQIEAAQQAGFKIAEKDIKPEKVIKRIKETIVETVFSADNKEWLERTEHDSKRIRYHVYFSLWSGGKVKCLMDYLVGPQMFLDRTTAQIDFAMGKMIKGANYEGDESLLSDKMLENMDEVMDGMSEGGQIVWKKGAGKIFTAVDSGSIPADVFKMWNTMYMILDKATGTQNVQGLSESPDESGEAIKTRLEAAYRMAYIYVRNLRRFRKSLGEGLLENIKEVYGSSERQIKILGDKMSSKIRDLLEDSGVYSPSEYEEGRGYVKLNTKGLAPIGELKLDVIVSRSQASTIEKYKQYKQLIEISKLKVQAGERPLPTNVLLPFLDIDPTIKNLVEEEELKSQKIMDALAAQDSRLKEIQANISAIGAVKDADKTQPQNAGQQ